MKRIIYILIGVLLIFIILLSVDLLTGIWFWNKENLEFSSSIFNNIATPISQFIGIITFSVSLYFIYKQTNLLKNQNKMLLSQHTKPYYEKQIELYKETANKYIYSFYIGSQLYNITPLNYVLTPYILEFYSIFDYSFFRCR